jgi:maltose operon periplasmic protein
MIRRPSLTASAFLLASLLAGCAGAPPKAVTGSSGSPVAATRKDPLAAARKQLADTPSCCNSFSDFQFKQTLPAEPRRFHLGPGKPVADFNGSRSYFLTFRLPRHKVPYKVVLKSKLTGGRWLHSSYLFAPSAVLLDARYRPLDNRDVNLCEYIGWTDATSGAFGSLTVHDPDARYLVIYSSGPQLAGSTYWEQSPTAFSADAPIKMASAGSFQIPHGPDGVLYIGMLTPKYRGPLKDAICGKRTTPSGGVLSTLRQRLLGADSDKAL